MPTLALKRRWLTFSLRTFLVVTLGLSLVLGYFGRAWWKAYRDSQPPTLYELAQIAKRHGIPMPPKGAKLVLVHIGLQLRGQQTRQLYEPAFMISQTSNQRIVVFLHNEEVVFRNGYDDANRAADENYQTIWHSSDQGVALWIPFSLDPAREVAERRVVDWLNESILLTAIQLADQGEDTLAEAIFNHWIESTKRKGTLVPLREGGDIFGLRDRVRNMAFVQLVRQVRKGNPTAWLDIHARMSRLIEESQSLRRDYQTFFADFSLTVSSPAPDPDSVEALLIGGNSARLAARGFGGVPELIRLCDDQRLTGGLYDGVPPGWENGLLADRGDQFERIGDLAKAALSEISGLQDGKGLSIDLPDEVSSRGAEFWSHWWKQAAAQGEREYYIRNFFVVSGNNVTARQIAAEVLAARHCDSLMHIGEEYREIGARVLSRLQMAEAITGLELATGTKVEIISNLAQHGTAPERRAVLRELSTVDSKRAVELLVELLDELPADEKGFGRQAAMNSFPEMAMILGERRLSRAYLAAARRNVSLRMELISRLAYWYSFDNERLGRLAFLAAFLDDETRRDRSLPSERFFDDDFAGITVRDFAAMHSAKLLKMEMQPDQDWTPEQWSVLRDQVRERLKQEELPALE